MNAIHARLAARGGAVAAFVSQPEPRSIGHYAKGRQLCAGNIRFAGQLIELNGEDLWRIEPPDSAFAEEMHGFGWLDDLAAVGDGKARAVAGRWVWDWIDRYGSGSGPGWAPEIAGRRLIRWINHALFLLRGKSKDQSALFFRSLGMQARFLARRWPAARDGLPRFEALAGTIYAGLALDGQQSLAEPAVMALARDCERGIAADGGIVTRDPEEAVEVLTLLNWTVEALESADREVPTEITAAIARMTPALRALRHADGGLARFHGGARGVEGRLDQALAASRVRTRPDPEALHMGYARMTAGRTSLVLDAAPPPKGPASYNAHASTLAFELTSGRRQLIVNCGSGAQFGAEWRRAGRATPSHSTLGIDGFSSSRLGMPTLLNGLRQELLEDTPSEVLFEFSQLPDGNRLEAAHNGYQATHGLTHARIIDLAYNGRGIAGQDLLTTLSDGDERRFDRAVDATGGEGVPYSVRFHLHPDVDAEIDLGGSAVSLALKSGEIWIFRHDNVATLSLEPSVYLEKNRLRPRSTRQVVLSGRAMSYATRVRWSLAKAQDTPNAVRDVFETDFFAGSDEQETT
ncbi:heparinase II/III domain-containing protein [Pelagovum pacificum]|uniref:Heparinase n=1 Tax=Pelagovum pacificum TaxID=2588711 RepID=A0A5C5GJU2_9RHOB|nr:heparinase II/III family protein [Pelagovum pacificum]QQA43130.1 heparinase II/III family protein [Pelagovum pacificum]TNY33726.1 heparinase [Pelagovum pacificum]